jgi:hypothetical protein
MSGLRVSLGRVDLSPLAISGTREIGFSVVVFDEFVSVGIGGVGVGVGVDVDVDVVQISGA